MDTSKFVGRFVEEARKHVGRMAACLINLEQAPDDRTILQDLFRTVHTLKGSANMMGYSQLSDFAHAVEHVLVLLRDGRRVLDSAVADGLLQCSDALGQAVEAIGQGTAPEGFDPALVAWLQAQSDSSGDKGAFDAGEAVLAVQNSGVGLSPGNLPSGDSLKNEAVNEEAGAGRTLDVSGVRSGTVHDVLIRGEKLDGIMRLVSESTVVNQAVAEHSQTIRSCVQAVKHLSQQVDADPLSPLGRTVQELTRLAGELSALASTDLHALSRTNAALKEALYNLRMVPLSVIFGKYPRIVREASVRFGKEVSLVVSGEDTELDKQLVDMIDESLMQMLRNAVDHGIEPPQVRTALGKPPKGTLEIHASYDRGMVRITISDDGAGIPVELLARKAVERHLMGEEDAQRIIRYGNADAIAGLVCMPGLSSAQIITDYSGRGVGMDIVHEHVVRSLHGTLSVATAQGKGTTFAIRLPLNTAILQATVFRIGASLLAVPTHVVSEVVRLEASSRIEVVRSQALKVREQIVPVLQVGLLFRLESDRRRDVELQPVVALLVRTASGIGAVLVDDLVDQGSYLIHALPAHVGRSPWVSGCIVGTHDKIMLLVNTRALMDHARQSGQDLSMHRDGAGSQARVVSVLVVDDSLSTREIERSILESHGYVVSVASDGQEAFDMALDTVYDVVVTDIEMPRMDGFELTRSLRSQRAYRRVPVILVTSRDSEEDKARGVAAGADAYIVKSGFDQEHLVRTIEALVG